MCICCKFVKVFSPKLLIKMLNKTGLNKDPLVIHQISPFVPFLPSFHQNFIRFFVEYTAKIFGHMCDQEIFLLEKNKTSVYYV